MKENNNDLRNTIIWFVIIFLVIPFILNYFNDKKSELLELKFRNECYEVDNSKEYLDYYLGEQKKCYHNPHYSWYENTLYCLEWLKENRKNELNRCLDNTWKEVNQEMWTDAPY